MTTLNDARVTIVLSDYASADAAGKLNVIGAGISMMPLLPTGACPPFTVSVIVAVPSKFVGSDYALTVELRNITTGTIVQLPAGPGGQLQPFRAQQAVPVQPVQVPPGTAVPVDVMCQHMMVMTFPEGLPLPSGSFEWQVQIDGQKLRHWNSRFHVLAPAAGLVFGGPAGSPDIPGVGEYVVDQPDEPDEPSAP